MHTRFILAQLIAYCTLIASAAAEPTGTAFTYQGQLKQSDNLVDQIGDLRFALFDAPTLGAQVGSIIDLPGTMIDEGVFTVNLDFGDGAFSSTARWLEIHVRVPADAGEYTILSPRQRIRPAPIAQFAVRVDGATVTNLNAGNISSGVLPSNALSGTYSGTVTFTHPGNVFSGAAFNGSGAGLNNLNASNIASGMLPIARGGTGASDAASALNNLGGAPSVHTHALSSMTGQLLSSQLPTGGAWPLTSNLSVANNTLFVDQSNSRVGIGLASPAADLHIRGAGALGSLLITPTTADTLSQVSLSENQTNTFGMIMRMDGAANQLRFLAVQSGVEQNPVVSINRSATAAVGIGTTAPAAMLHVAGNARVDGMLTIGSISRVMSLPTYSFQPGSNSTNFICNNSQLIGTSAGVPVFFGAPVLLPDGAVVTNVSLICVDNAAQDISMSLVRTSLTSGTTNVVATVTSSGASGTVRSFSSAVSMSVDNQSFVHALSLGWTVPPTSSDIQFIGARVTYSITQPLP